MLRTMQLSLGFLLAISCTAIQSSAPGGSSLQTEQDITLLQVLLNDMKTYTTTNHYFHAGDLYEHSIWTEQVASQWLIEPENPWSEKLADLDNHTKQVIALAALLHDVGKAGDLQFSFDCKPKHAQVGYEYVIGKRPYIMANGATEFDFNTMFRSLGISEEEQKLIAVLIAIHLQFGEGFMASIFRLRFLDKEEQMPGIHAACEEYLQRLEAYTRATNYNGGIVTEQLLRMAVFISSADARGNQPIQDGALAPFIFTEPAYVRVVRETAQKLFVYFGYDRVGIQNLNYLTDYFISTRLAKKLEEA